MMNPREQKKGEHNKEGAEEGERERTHQTKITDYGMMMEGISCRLDEKRAEMDWEAEVHEMMQEGMEEEEEIMKEKEKDK